MRDRGAGLRIMGVVFLTACFFILTPEAFPEWDIVSLSGFSTDTGAQNFAVAALGGARYCIAGRAANAPEGAKYVFKYFYTGGSVNGTAVARVGQYQSGYQHLLIWQASRPALVYLPNADQLCLLSAWGYEDWYGGVHYETAISGEIHSIAPDDIEDGYLTSDRWTQGESTEYWQSTDVGFAHNPG